MKNKLRQEAFKKRNLLTQQELMEKSKKILIFLETFKEELVSKNVFIFIDFKNEVQTLDIILYLKSLHCKIFIPRINPITKKMDIYPYTSHTDLIESKYGILEPKENSYAVINPEILEIVITPGVVFDTEGYRVGYGGGYYDRLFEKIGDKVLKIAVGFELQVVDKVPRDKYDKSVDYLITENQIYPFKIKK
ncbi:MAG: 5-formyltetrahydrofolate cyclo-ligase [Clostridiales bacterium]|nr:5-formyltetrahydrofolate cyclo-ligase [Clostridiales bacterium]